MDTREIEAAAGALRSAACSRTPIAPLTEQYPALTIVDAYRIQLVNVGRAIDAGARVVGHKVGLTSAAMQESLGVDQPDYGHLFADMFRLEHEAIDVTQLIAPRIEPEIAFVLGRPLQGPRLTLVDVLSAVDYVLPALEVIDSRIEDWRIRLEDTVADNASSALVVLGGAPSQLGRHHLRHVGCSMTKNGRVVATGSGSAVLGNPLHALVWLANTLGENGTALEAGQVVLPGSCTAAAPVGAGDSFVAHFGELGSVSAMFNQVDAQ